MHLVEHTRSLSFATASTLLVTLLLSPVRVSAQNAPAGGAGTSTSNGGTTSTPCGWDYSCPKTAPCCSEFGGCGSGSFCLAGCNPQGSFGQGFCAPTPVCANANYTFADTSRIQMDSKKWKGDATEYDFVLDHQDNTANSIVQNNELNLILTEKGGGTRLSTTRTILYGNIAASIKSTGQNGIVTAFITMSGVKDEIDWEFTTSNTSEAQNNYYWEGDVNNYENGGTAISRNRDTTYHVFGINWTPDRLDWTIDGKTVRTLLKSSTKNGRFPQTPSRIQFSVWPAGISSSPQGTIDWAGGLIDWSKTGSQGYFASQVQWLSVQCYDNSDLPYVASNQTSSSSSSRQRRSLGEEEPTLWERDLWERAPVVNSYVYGTNDSNGQIGVSGSNAQTIINSPYSTGQNMLVKGSDTKGVTSGGNNGSSGGLFGNSAVGNWWDKLATAAKAGIIIGICAVALFILVALCTCFARRKDQRKKKLAKEQGVTDSIPLVAKNNNLTKSRPGQQQDFGSRSDVNLPGKLQRHDSDFDAASISSSSKGGSSYYHRSQSPVPPMPSIPAYYAQQQSPQAYGGGYSSPLAYGGNGGYSSPQQQHYAGGAPPYQQHQQQYWPQQQGGGRY